jgi:glycosyltransferase involved in cell wall biosynthesis
MSGYHLERPRVPRFHPGAEPMSPRRILLVVRHPVGGIRTWLKYFYPLMHGEMPLEITVVAPRTDQAEVLERDLASLPGRYLYLRPGCTAQTMAARIDREIAAGGYDLVHSHGFTAAAITALVARLRRVAHLTTVHDVLQDSQFTGLRGAARKSGLRLLLGLVDVVHAVSGDVQRNLLQHFGARLAGRVRVVRNGVLTRPILEARPRDLRGELGLAPETLLVGFFGRFMNQKGFRYLVEAMRLLQTCNSGGRAFHVAAFGGGGYVREERAALEQAGMAHSFSFFPFQPDVAAALKSVDVVVIPSLWEASSLLGMEAMVAGIPVIGTSCIGLSEVLAETPATIVAPADGAALAAALEHERRSSSRGAAAAFIATAVARFDVAERVPQMLELLKELRDASATQSRAARA